MSTGLIDIIKQAAMDAVDANKPTDLRYGTVVSTSPLKVQVTHQFTIPESMLVVPQHLTDYEVDISITSDYGWNTQNREGGIEESAFASHDHPIMISEQKMKVHNKLKVGDKVALLRKQGGQSYHILDRV